MLDSVLSYELPGGEHGSLQIGPYRIVREIGRGGMGVVYEAYQEKPLERRVALKLVRSDLDTPATVARFDSERQVLARMDHPNIAQVYDAGATVDGRPYFAMELVNGFPITDFCDSSVSSLPERLRLFVTVCRAVHHAHQKGIIHRDLKPANVLVATHDGQAVPKVIDFGIAKVIQGTRAQQTLLTQAGEVVGTPSFMSPEQLAGDGVDIDTRTDIYALGALFYRLLVSRPLFELDGLRCRALDDLRYRIRFVDPPTPSRRIRALEPSAKELVATQRRSEPRRLIRALRDDLDWITMKALAKDRGDRYPTALDLAADVERYLSHEPVQASPPSVWYRGRKFARRHRAGLGVAAATTLALLGAASGATVGLVRATAAERIAASEAEKLRAINGFMQRTLGSASPVDGIKRDTTVVEALATGVAEIDGSFDDQPEVEAELRHVIGTTYLDLGAFDAADEQLEQALTIRETVFGKNHRSVADTLYELGRLDHDRGDHDASVRRFRRAVQIQRDTPSDEDLALAFSIGFLAICSSETGEPEAAEHLFRESLERTR